ncbi:major facilitator superfamily domain-containing protein [Flagelloscypha sp. PMI_526]|nr:major facilitator superfamily domain-containing protein [Flagelloscypha sp. PMI_526]
MVKVETVVFLSLVLDLLSFTMPLPLFPRIIEWYTIRESSNTNGFLSQILSFVGYCRTILYANAPHSQRWDVVLLGGLMGSVFSTLQFIISPVIGTLSDKYGRKRVLLITMIGNILSAAVWLQSTTFASYLLSRIIGGASEGNVQLAIAILSDVTTPETRSKALAYVGIAFAICFCVGPPIGAYFATKNMPQISNALGLELNIYAVPAAITLVLLILETLFLAIALPETRGQGAQSSSLPSPRKDGAKGESQKPKDSAEVRIARLRKLELFHLFFLGIFSVRLPSIKGSSFELTHANNRAVEFTLTFLTFDLFDWSNKQNGMLIGSIGILSALLQGGYTRRATSRVGEVKMARRGVTTCFVGFILLGLLPRWVEADPNTSLRLLQGAAACLAFTSATVVNSLTAAASLQCDEGGKDPVTGKPLEEHPHLAKGKALGRFRSAGQLGRAIGPLLGKFPRFYFIFKSSTSLSALACAAYWTLGPATTYSISAATMFLVLLGSRTI